MCDRGQLPGAPRTASEALDLVMAGFGWLADADLAAVPVTVRACGSWSGSGRCRRRRTRRCCRPLIMMPGSLTTGRARPGWLRWQTQVTAGAASGAVGWMRRLRGHRAVARALREAKVSASWARQICDWTDLLPGSARQDADVILLAAAAGGADLADLARLARHMRQSAKSGKQARGLFFAPLDITFVSSGRRLPGAGLPGAGICDRNATGRRPARLVRSRLYARRAGVAAATWRADGRAFPGRSQHTGEWP